MANYPIGMQQLFEAMLLKCASDLHLKAGSPPGLRVDGRLAALEGAPLLEPQQVEQLVAEITAPEHLATLKDKGDLEFSHSLAGVSRYRVSLMYERDTISAVLRRIPVEIPDIDRLGLPPIVKKLALQTRGLVLVTGPTGSGKSTTLAAMVDFLNREAGGHILTMEDPIEFIHRDQRCFITQREIGTDCESFELALRRALRHDPDCIMIGELRDRETISLALTAAETGHLVLATVHTPGAVQTVERLLDAFPTDERNDARGRIALALQGVLSQTLIRKVGGGRVAVLEVMVVTEAIRSCIREGKSHTIASQIQTGFAFGMQTQTMALADLVRKGLVTEDEAMANVANIEELRHQLQSGGNNLRSRTPPAGTSPLRRAAPQGPPVEPLPPGGAQPASGSSVLEKLRRS